MHMNTMIALRRVRTPTTPIVNRTAEKNSASGSIGGRPPPAKHNRAHDRGEQQHARHLEGEEILIEKRSRDGCDDTTKFDLTRQVAFGYARLDVGAGEREDLREQRDPDRGRYQLPASSARVGDVTRLTEIQ